MSHLLQAQLFGRYSVQIDQKPVSSINLPRLQVLFAYLLLHHNTPLLRSNLAYRLWPDSNETQARTNLRNLLHLLRQAMPEYDAYLQIENQFIHWQPGVEFDLDVDCFETELGKADRFENQEDLNHYRLSLESAVAVYDGELLPDCYAEWAIEERERLNQKAMQALERLIVLLENQRSYTRAISYVQHLLRFDPLQESAYRHLMRLHLLTGNRGEAIAAYHTCEAVLQRELSVRPSPPTDDLYRRILKAGTQPLSPLGGLNFPAARPPLIGRQLEWDMLQSAWQKACAGEPCFFLLSGESGLGKTCLVNELLHWAHRLGISAAYAHCQFHGGSLDYSPVAEWLGTLKLPTLEPIYQSEIGRLLPDLLARDGSIPQPLPVVEGWQRQRLFEALARALLGVELPLLLVLDNLQECDSKTLEFLLFMLGANPHAPWMVVAALRPEEYSPRSNLAAFLKELGRVVKVTEMELAPLEKPQATALAEALTGQALDRSQADALFRETEGNPRVITELVRANPEVRGWLSDHSSSPLPPAIHKSFEERLARLSIPAYNLAGIAAAIGRQFSHQILQIASHLDEGALVDALDELFQQRILYDGQDGTYRFSHIKLHEVIYLSLSTARRNWYLRRIAEAESLL